jgi:hypothetical protein
VSAVFFGLDSLDNSGSNLVGAEAVMTILTLQNCLAKLNFASPPQARTLKRYKSLNKFINKKLNTRARFLSQLVRDNPYTIRQYVSSNIATSKFKNNFIESYQSLFNSSDEGKYGVNLQPALALAELIDLPEIIDNSAKDTKKWLSSLLNPTNELDQ